MQILNVVGARPNLMKMAPLMAAMAHDADIEQTLLHTGQHYDEKMSQIFFDELRLPEPDVYLGVGSGSHAEQTAQVMIEFEKVLLAERPSIVVVVGDVNSTLACSIVAAKAWIPVAHVEAGLRSLDRHMPEEINRIVTDALSDILFTTSRDANENLRREGIPPEKIFFVGNVMIDTLLKHRARAAQLQTAARFGLRPGQYGLLTLHRPSNVDVPAVFAGLLDALTRIQHDLPVLFPAHPRTVKRIAQFGFADRLKAAPNLHIVEPLGYMEFLDLMIHARMVLTDSGGIQEETTILGVPCLTMRENTERPVTVIEGTNILVGTDPGRIVVEAQRILAGKGKVLTDQGKVLTDQDKEGRVPELWDGRAAERIVTVLREQIASR